MIGVKDSLTRTSNIEFPAIITSRQQFIVDLIYNLITNKERFFIRGFNQYNNFSEYYYGIGNNTTDADGSAVEYQSFRTNHRIVARVEKRDPRNNVINSMRGAYIEVSTLIANQALGSQYSFNNITLDARNIFPVGRRRNVLAVQTIINHNQGELPWRQMAAMGGFTMMRGYYLGRHRDKNYAAFQAEYRLHVWKFFGMTFFGAAGEVAPKMEDLAFSQLKFSGGGGYALK